MGDPEVLAETTKVVGVLVAGAGAVVTAPGAVGVIGAVGRRWASRQLSALLLFLRRVLRRPRSVSSQITARWAVRATVGSASPTITGSAGQVGKTVEDQLTYLRKSIGLVDRRVGQLDADLRSEVAARTAADKALAEQLQGHVDQLERALETERQRAKAIDARGLPLVWAGIALTALPDEIAMLPWWLGWLFPSGALVVATALVWHFLKPRDPDQDTWPGPQRRA